MASFFVKDFALIVLAEAGVQAGGVMAGAVRIEVGLVGVVEVMAAAIPVAAVALEFSIGLGLTMLCI